jgi:3-hydroxyacyl-[acyl-carrier-protein] dehydratase
MHVHEATLHIPATHAALAGHFPGRPIVPGVVLLDCVLAQAERWLQRPLSVSEMPQAKFLTPLLPEQEAQLQLRLVDTELRFTLMRGADPIAQGLFKLAPERGS